VATHKSSEKRARTSEKQRVRNSNYLTSVRTAVKKFQFAVNGLTSGASKDLEQAKKYFKEAQSILQKAATKGVIKKTNAARRVKRLAHSLKTVSLKKK